MLSSFSFTIYSMCCTIEYIVLYYISRRGTQRFSNFLEKLEIRNYILLDRQFDYYSMLQQQHKTELERETERQREVFYPAESERPTSKAITRSHFPSTTRMDRRKKYKWERISNFHINICKLNAIFLWETATKLQKSSYCFYCSSCES